jgi:branched-chain amino acid transport system substrate-binding protein
MKRITGTLLAAVLLLALLAMPVMSACGESAEPAGTVKIGTAYSTGGPAGKLGGELALGARLATQYYNEEKGGLTIDGKKYTIELIEYNSNTNPQEGVSVIKRLIEVDKVSFILGDCISGIVLAQQPVVEEANWPWIMAAAHPLLVSPELKYTNRCQLDDTIVIDDWWSAAMAAMGDKNKVAVLCANNDFSKVRYNEALEYIPLNGGEVVYFDFFDSGATDFYPELTKIKAANPDVIYMSSYGEVASAQKQAAELGLDVQWYHDDTIPPGLLASLNGELAVGTRFFTIRDPEQESENETAYRSYIIPASEAGEGAIYFATYAEGWDSAIRAFKAMELAGTIGTSEEDRAKIVTAIRQVDWDGAATVGSFNEVGQIGINAVVLELINADGTCKVLAVGPNLR